MALPRVLTCIDLRPSSKGVGEAQLLIGALLY